MNLIKPVLEGNAPQTICLLNDSFPPLIDGVANCVMNYAVNLPKSGYRSVVITPDHPQADDARFPYPVMRYPSIDVREFTGYLAGIPFSPEIASQLSHEKVALIHSHCPVMSNVMARQLRQIMDVPIVMTYHTKFDQDIDNITQNKVLQLSARKILVENITACDEVWTVSRGAGENLRSLGYEGDYIVMPNGVDLPRQRVSDEVIAAATAGYDLPESVPVYLFVGRMLWYKGQKLILDALAKLHADGEDFRMVFIGDGEDKPEVEAYAQQLGLEKKCIFTGIVSSREALSGWYCRAHLFLFPSTYDTNGLVVREAAACSLGAVLVAGSCAAEDVTDGRNGLLIEENADSLYACLSGLHGSIERMRAIGDAAAAELYLSWEDAVKLAQQRYQVVIEQYRSGRSSRWLQPVESVLKANGELMDGLGQLVTLKKKLEQYYQNLEWYPWNFGG